MKKASIKKTEIQNVINQLPENKLDEIKEYVDYILYKLNIKSQKPKSLKGIWKNKGFEKIKNLEEELKNLRSSLSESVLKKEI